MRARPFASRGALALALLLLLLLLLPGLPAAAQPGQGTGALAAAAPAAPVAPPLPTNLPLRREGKQGEASSSWLLASGLLVVLAVGALALAGRRGSAALRGVLRQPTGQRGIERLASQSLTAQASVHAIRWQGEELLVACTPHEVQVLARRLATLADGDTK